MFVPRPDSNLQTLEPTDLLQTTSENTDRSSLLSPLDTHQHREQPLRVTVVHLDS